MTRPGALLLALLPTVGAVSADNNESSAPLNVLFLVVDDMKDWIGCLNGYAGTVQTPHIDRLAAGGMLFRNAHCPSPKCAPSRAAVLTGRRASSTGLYDNGHWWLPNYPDIVTIPAWFRQQGYFVAGAGKIFHHTAGNHPPNQWDDFRRLKFLNDPWFRSVKLNYPWSPSGPYPDEFPYSGVTGLGHENDWGSLGIAESEYDDTRTADYAIQFLNEGRNGPFFLACGLFRPHLPWYVPQEYFDRYPLDEIVLPQVPPDDLEDIPPSGLAFAAARRADFETIRDAGRWREAVRAYLASISYADTQLGRVLAALRRHPQAERTIIVLWSDHGWHLGEKQHWHKTTLWEEATRVPLIVDAPGKPPGVCDRPVSLLDLFPTLVELCRVSPEQAVTTEQPVRGRQAAGSSDHGRATALRLDGISLVPLLNDARSERDQPAIVEFGPGNAAVRSQRYRYIRYRDGAEELYDHQSDPHEWQNLSADPATASLRKELARWLPAQWARPAATKKAFRFDPDTFTWTHKQTGVIVNGATTNPGDR